MHMDMDTRSLPPSLWRSRDVLGGMPNSSTISCIFVSSGLRVVGSRPRSTAHRLAKSLQEEARHPSLGVQTVRCIHAPRCRMAGGGRGARRTSRRSSRRTCDTAPVTRRNFSASATHQRPRVGARSSGQNLLGVCRMCRQPRQPLPEPASDGPWSRNCCPSSGVFENFAASADLSTARSRQTSSVSPPPSQASKLRSRRLK
mmetsp:Transcript_72606/g.200309  ORF Transcript_72606/g.200309 Transcript_72606/m.200309 type:complete len:201 (-) Transcript_72606:197-799(-)